MGESRTILFVNYLVQLFLCHQWLCFSAGMAIHKKILGVLFGYCWEKSINVNSINGLLMHAKRAHYSTFRKKCFISYIRISHVNSSVSIDTSVWTLNTFPGISSSEFQDIEGIADMSSRVLWNFMTRFYKCKEMSFDGNVLTHRTTYGNTLWYYWRTICSES